MTDILFRMVAPSLVMMTSPSGWHTCLCKQAMRQKCTAPAVSSERRRIALTHPSVTSVASWTFDRLICFGCCQGKVVHTAYHLVHASGSQARTHGICHSLCCIDVIDPHVPFFGITPSAAKPFQLLGWVLMICHRRVGSE